VIRVLALTAGELEEAGEETPPGRYCWLAFGSEARREQTLRTDQDNGLVYEDPPAHLAPRAAEYYARFAAAAIRGLVRVGFPACPGNCMASNPIWCQPASVWEGYFRRWMKEAGPEHVLAACIYFDVRPLGGASVTSGSLSRWTRPRSPSRTMIGRVASGLSVRGASSARVCRS